MSGPRLDLDVPEGFAAEARWTLETLLGACAGPTAESVRYGGSGGLDVSERAWELFAAGGAVTPEPAGDGMLDFGDGARDLVASAFWHLSRHEERGGARDEHGRFPARAALADPERPAGRRAPARLPGARRRPRCDTLHDRPHPRRRHPLALEPAARAARGRRPRASRGPGAPSP